MIDLIFLLRNSIFIKVPADVVGWLGWLAMLGLVCFIILRGWHYHASWTRRSWIIFLVFVFLVPITSLLLPGLRITGQSNLPPPLFVSDPDNSPIMFLATLPWFLAAGLLGPAPAAGLAALSGLLLALWGTHNLFLPVELALLAAILSILLRQRYRTLLFRSVQHPIVAAMVIVSLFPLLKMFAAIFMVQGSLAVRLYYASADLPVTWLAFGGSVLISGIIAEIVMMIWPDTWGSRRNLQPSPTETKLRSRFLYSLGPLAIILILFLILGAWVVASRAALQMVQGRMVNVTNMAAQSVPYILETGESSMERLSKDQRLFSASSNEEVMHWLGLYMGESTVFNQLIYYDTNGEKVASVQPEDFDSLPLSPEEWEGLKQAEKVRIQIYSVKPKPGHPTALISFIAPVRDGNNQLRGVLIGRSDLSTNLMTRTLIASLKSLEDIEGEGMLVDKDGNILYHPNKSKIMTFYNGPKGSDPLFRNEIGQDGMRQLVYYQPTKGQEWSVIMTVPAWNVQNQAVSIVAPLLGIFLLFSLIAIVFFLIGLRLITGSLQNLAVEADRIAHGQLDYPNPAGGEDEVGQLRRSFEQMRASLKARLDELNRLLVVSQGVASSLKIEDALCPVLEATLVTGASSARVVLIPSMMPDLENVARDKLCFGTGSASDSFSYLDEQVLSLNREQDQVKLTNLTRPRMFSLSLGTLRPHAILALALRHENLFYGSLWVAFDRPHQFSDEEVRYLSTLAGQAALAAANTRLFLTAEIGRQRLEAILASTPDPVLVTDHQERLLLTNPAALQILDIDKSLSGRQPVDQVIHVDEIINLLRSSTKERQSAEVILPDGHIYLATASSVMADGQRMGRVCVMRDITQFKELDTLKSEFVSTVSHDLRSPLTLLRGYATMLQMVGDLNDQQSNYVNKIVAGIESMSRLVNNLLDLGRIEAGVGLQLEKQAIKDVVESVVATLSMQAAQKRVDLVADIPDQDLPIIEADQALLQQALYNLVENGIKYSDVGGKVIININCQSDRVVFEVHDTGIGIAPTDQQRLFEKFYRTKGKGSKYERGSGLGLAIVKSITERHGGRVWVESQLGRGSTFYLEIPLRQVLPIT